MDEEDRRTRKVIRGQIGEGIVLGREYYTVVLHDEGRPSENLMIRQAEIIKEELEAAGFECGEVRSSIDRLPGKEWSWQSFAGVTPLRRAA